MTGSAVPLLPSSTEACPWGRRHHRATVALVDGDVRGVHCDAHQAQAEADLTKALRIIGRT